MKFLVLIGLLVTTSSSFAAPSTTYIKGSDGADAHQFKNPCKVSVTVHLGFSADRKLYLQPLPYTFQVTAKPAPGWKAVQAEYKNASGQTVIIPLSSATFPASFPVSLDLSGKVGPIFLFRVLFATRRFDSAGVEPEYREYVTIVGQVLSEVVFWTTDIDQNGLGDAWETRHFGKVGNNFNADPDKDGLTNLQEYQGGANPKLPDSDWDGINDKFELAEGTDLNNPESVVQKRIAYFPFDAIDLRSAEGQLPRTLPPGYSAAQQVGGVKGRALRIDQIGQFHSYDWIRSNGAPNYSFRKGTVRLWVKPEWSTPQMSGHWSRLYEIGALWGTGDAWEQIRLHANQASMSFNACDGNGHYYDYETTAPFTWVANTWHEVVMTYSAAGRTIYVDGVQIGTTATPWPHLPNIEDIAAGGLKFASDGGQPLKGSIDEVEFFNYELTPTQIQAEYSQRAPLAVDTNGNGIHDWWEETYFNNPQQDPLPPTNDPWWDLDDDNDGLSNRDEVNFGTDPDNPSSGDSGIPDGWLANYGYDPKSANGDEDNDEGIGDGLSLKKEFFAQTNPTVRDTDLDGVIDGLDGWALYPTLSPPRLPENRKFISFDLSPLPTAAEYRINNSGDVLALNDAVSTHLWTSNNAQHTPQVLTVPLRVIPNSQGAWEEPWYFNFLNNHGQVVGTTREGESIELKVWNRSTQQTAIIPYKSFRGNFPADLDAEHINLRWYWIDDAGAVYTIIAGSGSKTTYDGPDGRISREEQYDFEAGVKWVGNTHSLMGALLFTTKITNITYTAIYTNGIFVGWRAHYAMEVDEDSGDDNGFFPRFVNSAGIAWGHVWNWNTPDYRVAIFRNGDVMTFPVTSHIDAISDSSKPWIVGNQSSQNIVSNGLSASPLEFSIWRLTDDGIIPYYRDNADPISGLSGLSIWVNTDLDIVGSLEGMDYGSPQTTRIYASGIKNGRIVDTHLPSNVVVPNDGIYDLPSGPSGNAYGARVELSDNGPTLRIPFEIKDIKEVSDPDDDIVIEDIPPKKPNESQNEYIQRPLDDKQIAYIEPHGAANDIDPEMPHLVAKIVGGPRGSKVKWRLEVDYQRLNGWRSIYANPQALGREDRKMRLHPDAYHLPEDFVRIPHAEPNAAPTFTDEMDADQEWRIFETEDWQTELAQKGFFGGTAKLYAWFPSQGGEPDEPIITFRIGGKNPKPEKAKTFIQSHLCDNRLWFAYAIAKKESPDYEQAHYNQFFGSYRKRSANGYDQNKDWQCWAKGWPVYNIDRDSRSSGPLCSAGGYGIFQVTGDAQNQWTAIPRREIWNWQDNCGQERNGKWSGAMGILKQKVSWVDARYPKLQQTYPNCGAIGNYPPNGGHKLFSGWDAFVCKAFNGLGGTGNSVTINGFKSNQRSVWHPAGNTWKFQDDGYTLGVWNKVEENN